MAARGLRTPAERRGRRHARNGRAALVPAQGSQTLAYLNRGLPSSGGGEWLWLVGWWFAPWMPGLIWVRDVMVGDVMVDRSFRVERLGRSGLSWRQLTWEPRAFLELAGSLSAILELWA